MTIQKRQIESVPANSIEGLAISEVPRDEKLKLPQVFYDRDGDCIEFIIRDEDFYAERVNKMLTVYIGRDSNELVGSLIKGVHAIIKDTLEHYPGFQVDVKDGRIRLQHLFTAKLWSGQEGDDAIHVYLQQLRDAADQSKAEVSFCEA